MKLRRLGLLLSSSALLAFAPSLWAADDAVGFVEKFALAADREAVLSQLLPGSEEFYFYHALHYQNTRQKEKLTALLQQWAKRTPSSEKRNIIENREALLSYDADPQATLKFLREHLNLEFNHEQEARDHKPDLPIKLDPALISREVYLRQWLTQNEDLAAAPQIVLEDLVREKRELSPAQVRSLLAHLQRPDLPNLLELILADLQSRESGGFGEFGIHRNLMPEQMDELAKRLPILFDNQNFVYARLRKLAPSADADVEYQPEEREAWLDRAWTYASRLSPAFLSLKGNLLYQRLQHDRQKGVYDATRFVTYLQLPRRVNYANPQYLNAPAQQRAGLVDLNATFTEAVSIAPPIQNDEPLVRDYFLHLFAKPAPGAPLTAEALLKPYLPYVRDSWLKPILAEAMITAGLGDNEQWASLISPTAFQKLKDRVDVDFALTNPPVHAPAEDVNLDLYVKNAPKLIVKIYEINALSYFLTHTRQLNTDLPLDGLVANREQTHDFSADPQGRNPFLRTLRTFKFPELKGKRGAWVIEFIGGGKSSRALVRKGQWSLLQQTGPAGEMLTVLDEKCAPVLDAVVWLEGRKYAVDAKSGFILLPFTQQPGVKPVILADATGEFATLANLTTHAEAYTLETQFHLEREQLLARRQATLSLHSTLLLSGEQVSPDLLTDSVLTITSKTLDGISTTSETKAPKLDPARAFTHTFPVPERLSTLTATLTGKVSNLSKGGEKQDVSATETWEVNGIDKTEQVSDGHLSRSSEGYFFELLGKNGEPLADRSIVFWLLRLGFQQEIAVSLKTDEKGRVTLGSLEGIQTLRADLPGEKKRQWNLQDSARTWPADLHAQAGEIIQVPLPSALLPLAGDAGKLAGELLRSVSLLEKRGDTYTTDRRAALMVVGPFLQMEGLPAGDYLLRIAEPSGLLEIPVRVTVGTKVRNWLVAPNRTLELRTPAPLQIGAVQVDAGGITIALAHWNKLTRLQVAATRFWPGTGLWKLTSAKGLSSATATPDRLPSLYAAGRQIGDEYRYILERRYSKIFPGNELTRPGLLLNPWEVRSTDLEAQELEVMNKPLSTAGERAGRRREQVARDMEPGLVAADRAGAPGVVSPDWNFLATAAPVLFNLVPDEKGLVHIDRQLLGDRQFVQMLAEDNTQAVWRTLALPEAPTRFQDLRLTRNLDPAKPFTEKKTVTTLTSGQTLQLADILTSEVETYGSLGRVYALYLTLSGDAKLSKFAWLLDWPKLKEEEKRAKYSEFACHELSFFLSRKDPDFFAKVVLPYLKNKKDRTFFDEYLLGLDLRHWLDPWSYATLNTAEQCLLAQRLPGEASATSRHLREQWEMLPPNVANTDRLFETALRGHALAPDNTAISQNAIDALMFEAREPSASPVTALGAADSPSDKPMQEKRDFAIGGGSGLAAESRVAGRFKNAAKESLVEMEKEMQLEVKMKYADNRGSFGDGKDLPAAAALVPLSLADSDEVNRQRGLVRPFFRALGPTKEWAENNYYQLPIKEQVAELISVNEFWRDYAAWDGQTPFVSSHLAEASHNFSEMMLALGVLDLPFDALAHTAQTEGSRYTLTAAGPLVAFHKEILPAAAAQDASQLLVSQNFYQQGDRYREEDNEKFDKYITDEFLTGVVYGANVVVTNPTSTPQKLEVLLQIPRGSLPVLGSKATQSKHVELGPYTTQTFDYWFYFPLPSPAADQPFPHYPVHVARQEQNVGAAQPFTFKVVRQLSQVDKTSWDYVSQYASEEEVFTFLEANNLERLDLERVAWRVRQDVRFFHRLVTWMASHHLYEDAIYSYAVVHNDPAILGEWLRHQAEFLTQCGPYLKSKLLTIDPIEQRTYEHLEYTPLVNQRAHRVSAENRIANPVLRGQYQALLQTLAHKPALEPMDQMSVVYYLFAQDRVEEALARFHTIQAEALPTRLQHDYFRCYAAFYEENLAEARGLANQYADYPVDKWRKLFVEVGAQLAELAAVPPAATVKLENQPDREAQQADLTASEPSFEFKVENRQIALTWRNLPSVTVNYYLMEPEFLFSTSPFVTEDPGRFSVIKPTKSAVLPLPPGKDTLEFPLPPDFAKANVLVEILGGGQRHAQAYHANSFKLALTENYGRLELREQTANQPVAKAYVKVYAKLHNGTIRFFKDGYTDLRGKFDYASLNSSEGVHTLPVGQVQSDNETGATLGYQMLRPEELDQVERLSILLLHDAYGAMVREVNPPSQ